MRTSTQTIIEPKKGWQLIDWNELREYKDLFYFLVWRDVKVLYKQTVLGFTRAIIRRTSPKTHLGHLPNDN